MWYQQVDRRRALPDRRHLVADRDRRDHDDARCRAITPPSPALHASRFPGIAAEIVDAKGKRRARVGGGLLDDHQALAGDAPRASAATTSATCSSTGAGGPPDRYFTGDGARRDDDGYYWIMGRIDDVLNVAGHRLSTMEIESALVDHPAVAEAAVVGRPARDQGRGVARVRDR